MLSEFPVRAQQWRDFATAHSRGLRPTQNTFWRINASLPQRIRAGCDLPHVWDDSSPHVFATAHSRGLRPIPVQQTRKRVSLPQRIRAGCDLLLEQRNNRSRTLPQRIRAGCDVPTAGTETPRQYLCHSAFVRVATSIMDRLA